VSRRGSRGASGIRAFHRLPRMGDNVRRMRADDGPSGVDLPAAGDTAVMLRPDLLAERSFPSCVRARSIVEEARDLPLAGPRNPGEPRARERERRRRTYRVRDDAREPVCSDRRRLLPDTHNRHRCGSACRNHARRPAPTFATVALPRVERRELIT